MSPHPDRCPACGDQHACKGCGAPVPAGLDYDDVCENCLEWRFKRVLKFALDTPALPGAGIMMPRGVYCPVWERVPPSEVKRLKGLTTPPASPASQPVSASLGPADQVVDLDQIATVVHLKKRSMEKYIRRKEDPLPDPDFPAEVSGKAHHWNWSTVRPWLERNFNLPIPQQFPDVFRR
jgi:hypothetical protein